MPPPMLFWRMLVPLWDRLKPSVIVLQVSPRIYEGIRKSSLGSSDSNMDIWFISTKPSSRQRMPVLRAVQSLGQARLTIQ
ncbi:hypothetical protein D3C75_995390 [compost metagenome]